MVNERRSQRRVPVLWKATVTRLNGEQLAGSTDNVSRDGINVILPRPLLVGEPVRVELITQSRSGIGCYRLQGVAVYADGLGDQLGVAVGLRLLEPCSGFSGLLATLVDEAGMQAIA